MLKTGRRFAIWAERSVSRAGLGSDGVAIWWRVLRHRTSARHHRRRGIFGTFLAVVAGTALVLMLRAAADATRGSVQLLPARRRHHLAMAAAVKQAGVEIRTALTLPRFA